jgi:hypothetical protein
MKILIPPKIIILARIKLKLTIQIESECASEHPDSIRMVLENSDQNSTSCRLATLAMLKQKSELALKDKLCHCFDINFRFNKEVKIGISLISRSEDAML